MENVLTSDSNRSLEDSATRISRLQKMYKLLRDKGGASQKAGLPVVEKAGECDSLEGMEL